MPSQNLNLLYGLRVICPRNSKLSADYSKAYGIFIISGRRPCDTMTVAKVVVTVLISFKKHTLLILSTFITTKFTNLPI